MQMSNVVTANEQLAVLPDASVAVHVTVVVPSGKHDPDGGEHANVAPGQLSVTAGAKLTTEQVSPGLGVITVIAAGHVISGASVSTTVTVNIQTETLPEASTAVPVTVVVPFGNVEPEGGLTVSVTPGQLSVADTA
jgi:hypothetical protein